MEARVQNTIPYGAVENLRSLTNLIPTFRQLVCDYFSQLQIVNSPRLRAGPDTTTEGLAEIQAEHEREASKLQSRTYEVDELAERLRILIDHALALAEHPDVKMDCSVLIDFRNNWGKHRYPIADGLPEAAAVFVERLKHRAQNLQSVVLENSLLPGSQPTTATDPITLGIIAYERTKKIEEMAFNHVGFPADREVAGKAIEPARDYFEETYSKHPDGRVRLFFSLYGRGRNLAAYGIDYKSSEPHQGLTELFIERREKAKQLGIHPLPPLPAVALNGPQLAAAYEKLQDAIRASMIQPGIVPGPPSGPAGPPIADSPAEVPDRLQTVGDQYGTACDGLGKSKPKDREAYEWVVENLKDNGIGIDLSCESWIRYLREWRKRTNNRKNRPRGGRKSRIVIDKADV